MPNHKPYDALIVGGGHNGLTCACYLAGAGLKVRVLERRAVVGGAAVTEEFFPGFRNSTAAYTVSLLHSKVIRELKLAEHGLKIVSRPIANFLPLPDGKHLKVGSLAVTRAELARFSERDAARLPAYYAMLGRVGVVLRELMLETPPNLGGGARDVLAAFKAGNLVRRLDMAARRDFLDLLAKSAGDLLDGWFESGPIKAAFGFDAVVGNYASPYAPGSAYVLLHHVIGEVNGERGAWGHALGGMGSITQAMAREAERRGVEITTGCEVAKVCVDDRGAQGVQLSDGRVMEAKCVVANVNPKLLFLKLMDENTLAPEFLQRIRGYKCASATFRMNVALSELPDFTCLPGKHPQQHHQSGIIIAPSLAYMEQAYFDARTYGCSRAPIVEMLIPSTVDDSLAPRGSHVASLFCQHFAPELPGGLDWDGIREDAADHVIDTVTRYAPNFKGAVLGRSILSPLDLEREFGLTGGDIFHGALTLDQLWNARPVLGHADYRAPVKALYLCGAGTHPGGGVSGLPGHNAAREIIRDFRSGKLDEKEKPGRG
ncbi:MAG: NAD(P)/FAD-dependent oxidoreductase [Betaproteobacteria bacterium]|nr:NAD(P)/FAD-dependent oxidoreductase [Betaproteobacteria bacterium]MBI2508950.1 NAD(P)/FAD-dependent oxidoreductase [Betaproteobacteria bacterium]